MTGSENKNIIDFDKAKKRQQSKKKTKARPLSQLVGNIRKKGSSQAQEIIRWVQFIAFLALTAYILRSCGFF